MGSECHGNQVYVSTDLVFDGEDGNYCETSLPKPVNYYGLTKHEGERLCLQSASDVIVIRITLQYGWGNGMNASFSDWLMTSLRTGAPVSLFTDQYRTLTYVMDTAAGIEKAAHDAPAMQLYHLTGPERINRYEFGLLFAKQFNLPPGLIKKSCMKDVPTLAQRPKDVSLDGNKFFAHFGFQPRDIREGLSAMAQDVKSMSE
jgi:dTDP-4-dehydrorhamnose reductase